MRMSIFEDLWHLKDENPYTRLPPSAGEHHKNTEESHCLIDICHKINNTFFFSRKQSVYRVCVVKSGWFRSVWFCKLTKMFMLHSRSWMALTLWSPLMDSEFITGCYISRFCWQCISDHDLNSLVCALFILKSQRKMNREVWYTKVLVFWGLSQFEPSGLCKSSLVVSG